MPSGAETGTKDTLKKARFYGFFAQERKFVHSDHEISLILEALHNRWKVLPVTKFCE